ncbi:hypothetical protein [Vibrio renipiscarius]|uniref:Uncharacterized protein n=1 Tax=Vibrio renipiscarius TaxID=1461322 RepID=A0A0C2NW23_9VIBR|nr:hypothetical protein [Vibrio renipiscarius]KII77336.1 hypothetical protein PL18_15580 [Vibrio renipiscarius]KII78387.1 hypothetical protein OJ16_10215 [Vibrio renipiscarius]
MKNDCCYEMAKDIFVCHLGMSEGEAQKQLATIFPHPQNDLTIKTQPKSKLTNYSDNKKV